jgi:polar amino acid transport system substrate-binding protein
MNRARAQQRRGLEAARSLLALLTCACLAAACDVPRDPERTLEQLRGGTLRAGVVEAPPHLTRSGEHAQGPEAELVAEFAAQHGAQVEWRWGGLDEHMQALERFELDVVAAGLTTRSPWKRNVGFTRPWRRDGETQRVLAVPPGENALLHALDSLIETRERPPR